MRRAGPVALLAWGCAVSEHELHDLGLGSEGPPSVAELYRLYVADWRCTYTDHWIELGDACLAEALALDSSTLRAGDCVTEADALECMAHLEELATWCPDADEGCNLPLACRLDSLVDRCVHGTFPDDEGPTAGLDR